MFLGGTIGEKNNIDIGSIGGIANFLGTNVTASLLNMGGSAIAVANLNSGNITSSIAMTATAL